MMQAEGFLKIHYEVGFFDRFWRVNSRNVWFTIGHIRCLEIKNSISLGILKVNFPYLIDQKWKVLDDKKGV